MAVFLNIICVISAIMIVLSILFVFTALIIDTLKFHSGEYNWDFFNRATLIGICVFGINLVIFFTTIFVYGAYFS